MDNYKARYGFYDVQGYHDCEADDDKAQVVELPVQVYHGLLKAEEIVRRRACQQVKKSEVDEHGYKFLGAEKAYCKTQKTYKWKISKLTPYSTEIKLSDVSALIANDFRAFYHLADEKDIPYMADLLKCDDYEDRLVKVNESVVRPVREAMERAYFWLEENNDKITYEICRIRFNYQLGLYEVTYWANDIF